MVELAVAPGATSLPAFALAEGESVLSISLVKGEPSIGRRRRLSHCRRGKRKVRPKAIPSHRTRLDRQPHQAAGETRRRCAEGWVLDPFSHQAVATDLNAVGEPLVKAFGVVPPYAVSSDPLAADRADWTLDLATQFRKRRGYDLLPRLPELVAGGTAEAEELAMTGVRP